MKAIVPGISLSKFSGLPAPIKGILAVLAGGSMMTIAYFLFNGDQKAMLIIMLGIIIVTLLLVAYRAILGWFRKRRANPLSQGIAGNAAAAPQGISEPARRARLDDLRRNFDQGVEKFRAAGKNLYSVPWYVLVGEPGSGKTEAIRHCNVGFPPGLQDQLQGAGGTLNMNWWFTNQAIILDTAGRLMFEEVVPGSTNEWNEFLKLLKQNRPNCPINGILLVIPVDTLIKDSADSIEKKAGKIAQQFDQIQRILGVRFPVFIIITKCDLLNGFREFFDDLNDPQLQHQIMGWSNPAPLDEKFDPKAVTDHMENVKKRLTDRRQQLLLDPVNTEDATARRIDQVDALYALPDSLTKIAPRLRRYLEMVFVAGEWSPKPLFLRGIYFTSSMTEGSALDAELAEVLGVPVDSLPEGRVWRRDRAYFLRDLFIDKVFREKGLVTRADNADKQQRRRRAIVLTVGFLAVIALGTVTWLGHRSLENSIGQHRDFWVAAKDLDPKYMQVIKKNNSYNTDPFKVGKKETTIANLFGDNLNLVQNNINIPIIFKPMAAISGDVNNLRVTAYRSLYEATILRPIFAATRAKIAAQTPQTWTPEASAALTQLMKLEYAEALKKAPDGEIHQQVDLDPMFHYVLPPDDYTKYQAEQSKNEQQNLQKAADWIYTGEGAKQWPAPSLQGSAPESRKVVSDAINTVISYWDSQSTESTPRLGQIQKVREALLAFQKAETKITLLRDRKVTRRAEYVTYVNDWETSYGQLMKAREDAAAAWAAVSKNLPTNVTLQSLYAESREQATAEALKSYTQLLKYTLVQNDPRTNDAANALFADGERIRGALGRLRDWKTQTDAVATLEDLRKLDEAYLVIVKDLSGEDRDRRFIVQSHIYQEADTRLDRPDKPATRPAKGQSLAASLENVDKDATAGIDKINRASPLGIPVDKDHLAAAADLARVTIDIGARYRRFIHADAAANAMPADVKEWPAYVTAQAATLPPASLARPEIPLVSADSKNFNPQFSPDAIGACFDNANSIEKTCNEKDKVLDAGVVIGRIATVKSSLNSYLDQYRKYWSRGAFEELRNTAKTWAEFRAALASARTERSVRSSLEEYAEKSYAAFQRIGDTASETALKAEGAIATRRGFQDECKDVLDNWKSLSDNTKDARGTILAMDPAKFLEGYTAVTAKSSDSFVSRYWINLSQDALKILATEGQKDILEGLQELAKYERFPLAPPGDRKNDLTAQEVPLARAALEKIKGASGSSIAAGSRSIGQGGLTKDKDVDALLERLRGANLLKEYQAYLDKLEKFFVALPMDAKPITVSISVAKEKLKDNNQSVAVRFTSAKVAQGKKQLGETYVQSMDKEPFDVEYPGEDLTFAFRDVRDGPILHTETIPGIWVPFRLIKDPKVKVLSREVNKDTQGSRWTLEYSVKEANGKTWLIYFLLDFKAEVPDLKDWPVPPNK